jgi:hypothetical protein
MIVRRCAGDMPVEKTGTNLCRWGLLSHEAESERRMFCNVMDIFGAIPVTRCDSFIGSHFVLQLIAITGTQVVNPGLLTCVGNASNLADGNAVDRQNQASAAMRYAWQWKRVNSASDARDSAKPEPLNESPLSHAGTAGFRCQFTSYLQRTSGFLQSFAAQNRGWLIGEFGPRLTSYPQTRKTVTCSMCAAPGGEWDCKMAYRATSRGLIACISLR